MTISGDVCINLSYIKASYLLFRPANMRFESAVYVSGLSLVKYITDFRNNGAEEHIQVLSLPPTSDASAVSVNTYHNGGKKMTTIWGSSLKGDAQLNRRSLNQ
jgi:hypothetical protein